MNKKIAITAIVLLGITFLAVITSALFSIPALMAVALVALGATIEAAILFITWSKSKPQKAEIR